MKKVLIVILVLLLLLGGLFFWKGGHHVLYLAEMMEEYLDADNADQSLAVQVRIPRFQTNAGNGRIETDIRQLTLTAETFWTESADRSLFGLTAQGVTAWTDGKKLYMDTGNTYALPGNTGLREQAGKLALGLLIHGRVTKSNDTYQIRMNTQELELNVTVTADRALRGMTVSATLPNDTTVNLSLTAKEPVPHPIPREITDAMVRAQMEPPVALTEPLEILLPALENLLPLEGELTLGVECGILELRETVLFRMNEESADLERGGVIVSIDLPRALSGADPTVLALLLLRNGAFTRTENSALFRVKLDPETTNELCAALVPQVGELGIKFDGSEAVLTFAGNGLENISMAANGEVPFLFTTIPVAFQAELMIP